MVEKLIAYLLLFLSILFANVTLAEMDRGVDPMRPSNYQAFDPVVSEDISTEHWKLTAVLLSEQRSVAVINGKLLQPGGVLEGYRVEEIFMDKVILKNKEQTLILHRAGTGLKTRISRRK